MGGVDLHQELKSLCANTDWKYAVFWKLNHQDQMLLTCEEAYCNNNLKHGHDLVGLAVAKMSYRVYSIGEGIIGQVAGSDKHLWKSGHHLLNSPCHLDEVTAGITTVVFVDVAPHGVVQLGSLKTISEDLKLVNYIRNIFSDLQISLMKSRDCSPCVTDLSASSGSGTFQNQDRRTMWTIVNPVNNFQESEDSVSDFIQSTLYNNQNQNLFPAGCELYEALGPGFCKQKESFDWETVTTETLTVNEMPAGQRSASENLLEAVVAKGSMSFCEPVNSQVDPLASDVLTGGSGDMTRNVQACTSVEKQVDGSPGRVGKKRARPGESSRPRPRDRQLIQDRIKELRQLVPNGSKCSIDSLLEQTIKHMLHMQGVTKHADKLDKCAKSKLVGKEKGVQGEKGSSWAMEVGTNNLKLCPIIVENIGADGQMVVEMMCDEGVHFMEMTEAIRSLGLTILKGATEVYKDKTWMCFLVEGENNRNIHRVDILWSLIQILQLKTNTPVS